MRIVRDLSSTDQPDPLRITCSSARYSGCSSVAAAIASLSRRRLVAAALIALAVSADPPMPAHAQSAPPVPKGGIALPAPPKVSPAPGAPATAGQATTPQARPAGPPPIGSQTGDAARVDPAQAGSAAPANTGSLSAPPVGAVGDAKPLALPLDDRTFTSLDQVQHSWMYRVPAPEQTALGVKDLAYTSAAMALVTRPFITTVIKLENCEQIDRIFLGDPSLFVAGVEQDLPNVVAIQPVQVGGDSNLTLVTKSGRTYVFYLVSQPLDSDTPPDLRVSVRGQPQPFCGGRRGVVASNAALGMPATAFSARGRAAGAQSASAANGASMPPGFKESAAVTAPPGLQRPSAPPPASDDYLASRPLSVGDLRHEDFRILVPDEASQAIAPARVFHDGRFTYVDFGAKAASMRLPAAFLLDGDIDTATTQTVAGKEGEILVVHGIGSVTLKSGGLYVCLVYEPRGSWTESLFRRTPTRKSGDRVSP